MGQVTAVVENWSFALFVIAVFGIAILMLSLSWVLGGRTKGGARDDIFESGIVSVGGGHLRFPAKFYLVAMFFVVFDLESVFLYTWAVVARQVGWTGFAEAVLFMVILFAGLVYLWRQGGLDWGPAARRRHMNLPDIEGHIAPRAPAVAEVPH
ncbi:MAG TPA: NADH-quinone oxidoreductase subunit A [Nevskiaceae bacterium]|nr:NADH-quinone oxidoreductase subunit A [Nevskiaceae bacterium]